MKKTLTETLLNLSKSTNPNTLELGVVENLNPFKIKVSGLLVTKENILISECLIKHKRIISNEEKTLESILNIGDTLAVQEIENGQRYIILDKVVQL